MTVPNSAARRVIESYAVRVADPVGRLQFLCFAALLANGHARLLRHCPFAGWFYRLQLLRSLSRVLLESQPELGRGDNWLRRVALLAPRYIGWSQTSPAVLCGFFLFALPLPVGTERSSVPLGSPLENTSSTRHIAGGNGPTMGQGAPDIWLVEANGPIELYSNGLQILNEYRTSTRRRFYPVLQKDASGNVKTHRWGDRPVGIVLHSTESHIAAFSRANNERIRDQGRNLLLFIRRKTLYNFTIDRFGRVYRIVPEAEYAHHAGNSIWADGADLYLS